MAGELDDLVIVVGGDISPLQNALQGIPEAMAGVSTAASDAFAGLDATLQDATKSSAQAGEALGAMGDQAQKAAADTAAVDDAMSKLGASARNAGDAAEASKGNWNDLGEGVKNAGQAAEESGASFELLFAKIAGGYLTFQGLKAAIEETVTAFGELERSTTALGAITGDLDNVGNDIQKIVQLSDELAVPQQAFLTLTQRLTALGVAFEDIPRTLEAVTDGARAMNQSVETVGQRFDMVINSGTLMNRTLTAMGLTIQDVGKAMDMVGQSDQVIKDSFKGIADESERAAVLTEALWSKFGDLAAKTADDTLGAWQKIANAGREAFQDIGQTLDGFKGLAQGVGIAIKFIADVVLEFVGIVKEVVDVLIGLGGTMSSLFAGMSKAAADLLTGNFAQAKTDMQAAVEAAKNYAAAALENIKKDWSDTSSAIDKLWSGAMGTVRDQADRTLPHIDTVIKAHKDLIQTLINGADMLLAKMPQTYDTYIAALDQGGKSAQSLLSSVSNEIDKFIGKMQELGGATPKLLSTYGDLIQQQQKLKEWVDQDNFNKLAIQVDQFATKYADSIGKLDIDTLNWINHMQAIARDVPDALNKISDATLLGKVMESFTKVDEATKRWNETLQKADDAARKLGPDMLDIMDPVRADLDEMANKTEGWTKLLFDAVVPMTEIWAMQEGMKSSGLALVQDMENNIKILDQLIVLMEKYHQSHAMILAVEELELQKHIALNQAIGASGEATLQWTIQLEKVKVEHQAIIDQTMGLSNLYTGMVKDFGKAWQDTSKGIADALVSGQNFGAVMSKVLDDLKKQLSELVVNYLMTQLKDAILTNTNLLSGFSNAFEHIFGSGGIVSQGIGELDHSIATHGESITKTGQQAAEAIQSTTAQASNGISNIAASMTNTILPAISAVSAVISAIAGVLGLIGQAHMNKVLGQIEENTRRTDISIEGAGGVVANTLVAAQKLTSILDVMQGLFTGLFVQMSGDLDDIDTWIRNIGTAGLPGLGGGGGGADISTLQAVIKSLQDQIESLQQQLAGTGTGAGTNPPPEAPTPTGSAAVDYSALSTSKTATVPITLSERLLVSISENVAEIVVLLADHFKVDLGQLFNEMINEVKAGMISLPLQQISDALASLTGSGGLLGVVGPSGPFVLLTTATTDLATAATNATDATVSLATAATDTATQLTTASATIASAATAAVSGINALVIPAVQAVAAAAATVLGSNSTTLLPPVGSLPNVSQPATAPGLSYNTNTFAGRPGLQGPGSIQMTVNIQGGGGAAVARDIVNTLNAMGAKVQS